MFVMGLDVGYSNVKVAAAETGKPVHTALFPAGAAPVDRLPERRGSDAGICRVWVDGAPWAAGAPPGTFSLWHRALHQDYAGSDSYRALVHAALLQSGRDRVDRLVTGLPVSRWLDKPHREALARRLGGVHRVAPRHEVAVDEVWVIPQPIGGYLDVLWSAADGDVIEEGRVLVIDPGFFSVDWVVVQAGDFRTDSSGTSLEAMSVLLDRTARLITEEHGGVVPVDRIEEALRTGRTQVLLFGQSLDLGPYLRRAADTVTAVALEALRESIRKEAGSLDLILLTGGGAEWYRPAATALFPASPVVVPRQPERANARGFYYYGCE